MKAKKQIKQKLLKQKVHPKNTMVNSIPKGWEVLPFGSVFDFIPTYAVSREKLTKQKTKSKIQNIHYGDIHAKFNNEILDLSVDEELPFIKDEVINVNTFSFVRDGDLIIADVSEDYEGLGESVELKNVGKKKIVGGLHTFVARSKNGKTAAGFRCYIFRNHIVKLNLKKIATGSNVYGVSKTNLSSLKIILPSQKEQKKIAKILSDNDKAIELTEKFIAAKEKRKKGLMQQLLTAKRRFKEFKKEKWVKINFGALGETYTGLSGKTANDFGRGKPYIPYMNVFSNSRIDISNFDYVKVNADETQTKVKYGDILFTVSSETPDEVGMVSVLLDNVNNLYLNSFCFGVRLNNFKTLTPEFVRYYLRSSAVRKEILKLSQGSTRFNLSKNEIMKLNLCIPPSIKEQKKIASVLSACDEEITSLKNKLNALKQQKKGLMQILLTGKKRVKINEKK